MTLSPIFVLGAVCGLFVSATAQLSTRAAAQTNGLDAPLFAPTLGGSPLSSASYLGGGSTDGAQDVALTPDGGMVVVGGTSSDDFPTLNAEQSALVGLSDAFVTRFDASGALLWSTFLGGADSSVFSPDTAEAVALAPNGDVIVAGSVSGSAFPSTLGAAQPDVAGGVDGFVARFDVDGDLLWATLVGGSDDDYASGVAVDALGRVLVVGRSFSDDMPVTAGAFDETENSVNFIFDDAWAARLSADGSSFDYCTYLGGQLRDEAYDVAVTADGSAVIVGLTTSSNFPTTPGALDESFNGASGSFSDAFVLRLSPSGAQLSASTFFGVSDRMEARALALDARERPLVGGLVAGAGFPATLGAFQTVEAGGGDGWVASFEADLSDVRFATLIGGARSDAVTDVAFDAAGRVTVVGQTSSGNFPVFGATSVASSGAPAPSAQLSGATPSLAGSAFAQPDDFVEPGPDARLDGPTDGFAARLSADATRLIGATLLGGGETEEITALTVDGAGALGVVGRTNSSDFPASPGSLQGEPAGNMDGFVARLELGPSFSLATAAPLAAGARIAARGPLLPDTGLGLELVGEPPARADRACLLLSAEAAPRSLGGGLLVSDRPFALLPMGPLLRASEGVLARLPAQLLGEDELLIQPVWRVDGVWWPGHALRVELP